RLFLLSHAPTTHFTRFFPPANRTSCVQTLDLVRSLRGESSVYTLGGSPKLPPVTLAVSAVASRTTRMSRLVKDVTDVRLTPPNAYRRFTSPRRNSSVNGSWSCVNCSRGPSVTGGRVVVYGLARILNASIRFQPSIFTF